MKGANRLDSALQGQNTFSGREFERLIELSNDWYRKRGIAVIAQVPVPVIVTGRGYARVVGSGPVDWVGRWHGRPIAFDTKTTVTEKIKLTKPKTVRGRRGFRMAGGQLHQATFLADWCLDPEAIGFFLVHQRDQGRLYIVRGKEVFDRLEAGLEVRLCRGVEPLFPFVTPSSVLDVAQGRKPQYDYLEAFNG